MRIISGKFKGRRFSPPADKWPTRPTTDYAKEALFNILENRIDLEGLRALDLFGGTGNYSYELISRGAEEVVYVDKYAPAARYVQAMSKELEIENDIQILKMDAGSFLNIKDLQPFDLIIMDPPYTLPNIIKLIQNILDKNLLKEDGFLIVEHDANNDFEKHSNFIEKRKYGGTLFSFFTR